ncbi:cilia- and flagella-associated protein 100-like isoform X3 [Xyrichtys novacula]|uniref:Cilia- and flagella-associated protein 100-like isoform X3 n=1 Tax=Xyrichtys novacula TaxID=13765 RepID=A0AAV1GW89_XYRNO|nr:cilia- and flagella-associated protein 100-like isoform X3 [Xyrichtys novacula]CAJ1078081.1 cilia- and flagella-associated protein 100-like isoform X3 [Xyrichtys novacula]
MVDVARARVQQSILANRSRIDKLNQAIDAKEKKIEYLRLALDISKEREERERKRTEEIISKVNSDLERERQSNEKLDLEIAELHSKIGAVNTDLAQTEEVLNKYKSYRDIIVEISSCSPDDQSSQDEKLYLAHILSDPNHLLEKRTHLESINLHLLDSIQQEKNTLKKECEMTDTVVKNFTKEQDTHEALMKELEDQTKRMEDNAVYYKHMVQVFESVGNSNEDLMKQTLIKKVDELYDTIRSDEMFAFTTDDKLQKTYQAVEGLVKRLDKVPKGSLAKENMEHQQRQKSRQEQEQKRLQADRELKCRERSLAEYKPVLRRKLMPRSKPLPEKQKSKKVQSMELFDFIEDEDKRWEKVQKMSPQLNSRNWRINPLLNRLPSAEGTPHPSANNSAADHLNLCPGDSLTSLLRKAKTQKANARKYFPHPV